MPIYEYCCDECRQIFEEWQSGFEEKILACPVCGGNSRRVISNTSFVLKGGGWYVTDYGRGNGGGSCSRSEKAETPSAETKPAEKACAPSGCAACASSGGDAAS